MLLHRDASSATPAVISKEQNWRRNLLLPRRNHESAVNFYIKSRTWWRYRIRGEPHLSAPPNRSFRPEYDRSESELFGNILRKRKTAVISNSSNKVNDFVIDPFENLYSSPKFRTRFLSPSPSHCATNVNYSFNCRRMGTVTSKIHCNVEV